MAMSGCVNVLDTSVFIRAACAIFVVSSLSSVGVLSSMPVWTLMFVNLSAAVLFVGMGSPINMNVSSPWVEVVVVSFYALHRLLLLFVLSVAQVVYKILVF